MNKVQKRETINSWALPCWNLYHKRITTSWNTIWNGFSFSSDCTPPSRLLCPFLSFMVRLQNANMNNRKRQSKQNHRILQIRATAQFNIIEISIQKRSKKKNEGWACLQGERRWKVAVWWSVKPPPSFLLYSICCVDVVESLNERYEDFVWW
jgi:hypothetical protein